eukprot:6664052-Pyramimonas_sp.AAC.2
MDKGGGREGGMKLEGGSDRTQGRAAPPLWSTTQVVAVVRGARSQHQAPAGAAVRLDLLARAVGQGPTPSRAFAVRAGCDVG